MSCPQLELWGQGPSLSDPRGLSFLLAVAMGSQEFTQDGSRESWAVLLCVTHSSVGLELGFPTPDLMKILESWNGSSPPIFSCVNGDNTSTPLIRATVCFLVQHLCHWEG